MRSERRDAALANQICVRARSVLSSDFSKLRVNGHEDIHDNAIIGPFSLHLAKKLFFYHRTDHCRTKTGLTIGRGGTAPGFLPTKFKASLSLDVLPVFRPPGAGIFRG